MAVKKKLLIYAHYYVPDVASTAQLLKELAEGMLDTFDVTVICAVPSYDGMVEKQYKKHRYYTEDINAVKVVRIRVPEFNKANKASRVKNIISYFLGAIVATFKVGRQDYVFAISQPPILGGLLGVWGKWIKRARFIYNIQDFNPEQILAVGYSKNKSVTNMMMRLDKFTCRRSDLIITVGRDLVETVHRRFGNSTPPKTVMINNWIDEQSIYPLAPNDTEVVEFKERYGLQGKFVIMYSGNIGLYYDLEHLTKPKSDQSDSKGEKSQMDISSAFISDEQAPVSMEPGKGSLNNPAVLSKMRGTVHPTSGNAVLYMSHCARLSAKRKIVPFISVKFLRTTSGSPVQISQGRQMIQHIFQHFAIIHIGGSEADNKRNAIAIRYEMMFASRTTSIYGVGSCVFAPLFAWMTEPSIQALLQSIFFVSCKFCRMTW